MTNYLLAGGGTAGHVNPLLALADYIRAIEPDAGIYALGTAEGLEARLVPERGYELEIIERLPFPRRPNLYAIKFPLRFLKTVSRVEQIIKRREIDVVIGFGGYASAPAYEAARKGGVALVIHEANALPGMANRRAAKYANAVGVAFEAALSLPNSQFTGMPLRPEIEKVIRKPAKQVGRISFGLDPNTPTLLVTGGSLGAKRINDAVVASKTALIAAGIQVLHVAGTRSELEPEVDRIYHRIGYCDQMHLAIAAADFAISRAGASTVSEFAAVGLPAVYVPYAVGNGEQELNARDLIAAGGGVLVKDTDFDAEWIRR
jgi:UDP-N-acetylglucosamine--N-acetylmuramyl-(pentapeptide) pyrophosphoryl-undecaprenol N-acetylglucosamine transferase